MTSGSFLYKLLEIQGLPDVPLDLQQKLWNDSVREEQAVM